MRKRPPRPAGWAACGAVARRPWPAPTSSTGLATIGDIRRIIEIATLDALGLENSVARSRLLIQAALAAARLLEDGELEARLARLEAVLDDPGRETEVFPEVDDAA